MDSPSNLSIDYLDLLPDEILLEILLKTDDLETLSALCRTSKRINNICQDKFFWKRKYQKDFDIDTTLAEGETWQKQYKRAALFSSNSPISVGFNNYGVIDQNGNLYISGDTKLLGIGIPRQLQLGHISRKLHLVEFPQTVQGDNFISSKVVSISVGSTLFETAAAITENGKAYIWGNPTSATFSFQKGTEITYLPTEIILPSAENFHAGNSRQRTTHSMNKLPRKAIKIQVGGLGYIILLEDSFVYLNIGRNHTNDNENFKGLLNIKSIDISMGSRIYAIVSKNNKISIGGIIPGHRGLALFPVNFPKLAKRVIISSSIMVLSTTGEVYTFPVPNDTSGIVRHRLVKLPEPIVQISSTESSFGALSETGKLYMWGYIPSQTSGGPKVIHLNPVEISFGLPINYVSVGIRFIIAVTNDGMVNYWGHPMWKPE